MPETHIDACLRWAETDYWAFDELQRLARAKTDQGEPYNALEAAFVRRVGEGRLQRPSRRGRERNPPRDMQIAVAFQIERPNWPNDRQAAAAVGDRFCISDDGVLSAVRRARKLNVFLAEFNI